MRQVGATLHRGARASLVAEHRLQTRRLSNCGSRAQSLRGMWDLPRPGLEPVSPALAGRLSTTAPPGKPEGLILIDRARELGGKRAVLAMIDSLRPYPRFFFSWMLGGWKQPLAALSHPMATSTHTQSTCNSSDSGK